MRRLCLSLALCAVASGARAGEIEAGVAASVAMRPVGAIRVLVHLHDPAVLEAEAPALRALAPAQRPGRLAASLRERFAPRVQPLIERLRGIGGQDLQALWLVDAVSAELPRSRLREIAAWPEVERIASDTSLRAQQGARPRLLPREARLADKAAAAALADAAGAVRPAPAPDGTALAMPEHMAALDLARAWRAGLDGRGTTVAVVDSGVDLRAPGLAAAFRGGAQDWFDPYEQHRLPHDAQGHGTLVASLLVGAGAGEGVPTGVAPQARFIAARLFDDAGQGRLSSVFRVYQWLLDPDGRAETADAPQVVNNSWGFAQTTDRCDLKLARIWQAFELAAIPVVFAAGNDGPAPRTSMSPANNPGVISVGALDTTGRLARQSSRGPSACTDPASGRPVDFPTVHAPGIALPALDRIGSAMGVPSRTDGTSFAAALVSGALLLGRQAQPSADVTALRALLSRHASPADGEHPPVPQVAASFADPKTPRPRQRLALPLEDGVMSVDAERLAAALPRGVRVERLDVAEVADAASVQAAPAPALRWRAGGDAAARLVLSVGLSDGTQLPLELVPRVDAPAVAAAPARLLSGRRDVPLSIDLAALAGGVADPAALRWSQPLRGGRLVAGEGGALQYQPPKNFVGTDQFALRGTAHGDLTVKVMVLP